MQNTLPGYFRRMGSAILVALLLVLNLTRLTGIPKRVIALTALTWLASPAAAFCISTPAKKSLADNLTEIQRKSLKELAVKTWAFLDQFSSAESNWLCLIITRNIQALKPLIRLRRQI